MRQAVRINDGSMWYVLLSHFPDAPTSHKYARNISRKTTKAKANPPSPLRKPCKNTKTAVTDE
jgi:hypothetical protein